MESFLYYSYGFAFLGTVVLLWLLRPIAVRCGLLDRPGGRKQHSGDVPLVGGLAMAGGSSAALLLCDTHPSFLAAAAILILAGAWDDRFPITAPQKLLAQAVAAILIVGSGGVVLAVVGGASTSNAVGPSAGMILLTMVVVVSLINAINFVDGVDGLAGGLSFIALVAMAILAGSQGMESCLRLTLVAGAAVAGFLCFNLRNPWCRRAWVFMGDAGSMFLGLTLSWLCIQLSQGETGSLSLVTALWVLAVPLFDMVCSILRRLLNGCSPFIADRKHLHHLLLRAGFSEGQTLAILLGLATSGAGFGLLGFFFKLPELVMLFLLLVAFTLYLFGVLHTSKLAHRSGTRKVIFLNRFFHPDISATSQMLSDLAFECARFGMKTHVIASRHFYQSSSRELGREEEIQGVQVSRVWTYELGHDSLVARMVDYVSFFIGTGWRLLSLVRKGDVVVSLSDPPLIAVVAYPIARVRGAILANWVHDLFPEVATALKVPLLQGPLASVLRWLRDTVFRRAHLNVVLGHSMKRRLLARKLEKQQVRVIPNWADGETLCPRPGQVDRLRRQWGLQGKFIIGYSGNFGRAHDFATLLDAAELLKSEERFCFLLIGDGFYHEWLVAEQDRRHLDNLVFRPYQPRERLGVALSAADVHLVSLRPELEGLILPCKFYGIAAVKRPAIFVGDPRGELGRQLVSAGCGVAVPLGDGLSLASQIRHLGNNPQQLQRMGNQARALFESRFQKSAAVEAWLEVLSDLGLTIPGRKADTITDGPFAARPSTVSRFSPSDADPNRRWQQLPLPI